MIGFRFGTPRYFRRLAKLRELDTVARRVFMYLHDPDVLIKRLIAGRHVTGLAAGREWLETRLALDRKTMERLGRELLEGA